MRAVFLITALAVLAGCAAQQSHGGGTLSKEQFLSALQAVPAPMKTSAGSAPMVGLVVSGTITNDGKNAMQCSPGEFVLVRDGGNDIAPSAQFCGVPSIAPQQSTYFNATFPAPPRDDWQLRFEHGDGSYEVHDLIVPPG